MEKTNPEDPDSRYYIIGLSDYGIEGIIDISDYSPGKTDELNVIRKLKGLPVEEDRFYCLYNSLSLRARFNSHRNLGWWGLVTTDGVTLDDLDQWADLNTETFIGMVKEKAVIII